MYQPSPSHDDKLFLTQLFVSTYCLMRLSELIWPNNSALQNYHKITMHHSVQVSPEALSFWLPGYKGDQCFEGNWLFMQASANNPFHLFLSYLSLCDSIFQAWPKLWLCSNRTIPTWYWLISCLCCFFPMSIAGQSMCAGGLQTPSIAIHEKVHLFLNLFSQELCSIVLPISPDIFTHFHTIPSTL